LKLRTILAVRLSFLAIMPLFEPLGRLWLAAPHPYPAELSKPAAMTLRNARLDDLEVAVEAKKDSV
jgi:hypothetical protein